MKKTNGKQVVSFDPGDNSTKSPRNKLSYASEGTSEGLAGDLFDIQDFSKFHLHTQMCIVYILFVSMFINDYNQGYTSHAVSQVLERTFTG